MDALELEKRPEDIEKDVRAGAGGQSLSRRAGRIFRAKIYLRFHEGERRDIPPEAGMLIAFIASIPPLWILAASVPAIRRLISYPGLAGFVATTATIVLYAVIVYLAFSALNRLADRYFKNTDREP